MKWIVDEELAFHNLNNISRIRLKIYSIDGVEPQAIQAWDNTEKFWIKISYVHMNSRDAQEYFISYMNMEFGEENIHFLED